MRKTTLLLGCDGKGLGAVDNHGPAGRWRFWPTHSAAVLEDAEIVLRLSRQLSLDGASLR